MLNVRIVKADYDLQRHASDVVELTDLYAQDPMGLEEQLPNSTRINLIRELKKMEGAFSLIAYLEEEAVGIANCFIQFSTFEARKTINIHDLAVREGYRGLGIGTRLLKSVQGRARDLSCCRITLEVREDNPALDLYERFGFENNEPKMWYMTKELY